MYWVLVLLVYVNGAVVDIHSIDDIKTYGRCHQIGLATGATTEVPTHDGVQYVCQPTKDLVN